MSFRITPRRSNSRSVYLQLIPRSGHDWSPQVSSRPCYPSCIRSNSDTWQHHRRCRWVERNHLLFLGRLLIVVRSIRSIFLWFRLGRQWWVRDVRLCGLFSLLLSTWYGPAWLLTPLRSSSELRAIHWNLPNIYLCDWAVWWQRRRTHIFQTLQNYSTSLSPANWQITSNWWAERKIFCYLWFSGLSVCGYACCVDWWCRIYYRFRMRWWNLCGCWNGVDLVDGLFGWCVCRLPISMVSGRILPILLLASHSNRGRLFFLTHIPIFFDALIFYCIRVWIWKQSRQSLNLHAT